MTREWYYTQNGRPCGPVTEAQVWNLAASGQLQPTDLIWYDGLADWIAAEDVPGLIPPQELAREAPRADELNPYQAPQSCGETGKHAAFSCPMCGELTDNLKQYRAVNLCLFLGFLLYWQDVIVRACPKCMRRFLLKHCLLNIIPANVFWLIFVLPLTLALVFDTCRRGHSRAVLKGVTLEMLAERQQARAERQQAREELWWGWLLAASSVLLFWLPVMGFVIALLAFVVNRRSRPSGRYRVSRVALLAAGVLHVALVALIVVAQMRW